MSGTLNLSPYELRHLPAHLETADAAIDLHRLLALDTSNGKNAWYEAKELGLGDANAFSEDISRAWRLAENTAGLPDSEAITLGVRYALVLGSLNASAGNVPPALLLALLDRGLWSSPRVLGIARRISDPTARCHLLNEIAHRLCGSLQRDVAAEALRAIEQIEDDADRADLIAALASVLDRRFVAQATVIVDAVSIEFHRRKPVRALMARRAALGDVEGALREIDRFPTASEKAPFWIPVLPYLSGGDVENALKDIFAVTEEWVRANLLGDAAVHLQPEKRLVLLEPARAIINPGSRADALSRLVAAGLPAEQAAAALDAVLPALRQEITAVTIKSNLSHPADTLLRLLNQRHVACGTDILSLTNELAEQLDDDARSRSLFAQAAFWLEGEARERAIVNVLSWAHRTPQPTLEEAVASTVQRFSVLSYPSTMHIVPGVTADFERVKAILAILPALTRTGYEAVALNMVKAIDSPWWQASTLQSLAPHLTEAGLRSAVEIAEKIKGPLAFAAAATCVAERLEVEEGNRLLLKALDAASALGDGSAMETCAVAALSAIGNAGMIAEVLPALPQLADDAARAKVLHAMTAGPLTPLQVPSLLPAACELREPAPRLEALCALAARADDTSAGKILDSVVEMAFPVCASHPGPVFFSLIPRLLERRVFKTAIELSRQIGDRLGGYSSKTTDGRTTFPSSDARVRLCGLLVAAGEHDLALSLAQEVVGAADRVEALLPVAGTAGSTGVAAMEEALKAAPGIRDPWGRLQALARITPYVPPSMYRQIENQGREALQELKQPRRDACRQFLAVLIAATGDADRAIDEARNVRDATYRARAIAGLVDHIPEDKRSVLLRHAWSIRNPSSRAEALEPLIPHLRGSMLVRVVTDVLNDPYPLGNFEVRLRIIARAGAVDAAITAAWQVESKYERFTALLSIASFLSARDVASLYAEIAEMRPKAQRPVLEQNRDQPWEYMRQLATRATLLPSEEARACWRHGLRTWSAHDREILTQNVAATMPVIAAFGGVDSVRGVLAEVRRVQRWWP